MRTRTLGKSGLVVSELTLGTLSLAGELYGPVEPAEADRTIARARELGVTLFETADVYGATGESMEARLGRVLERDDQAYLVTKGGNDAQNSRKRFDRMFLHRSAARSADRLRRKPDVYLLHHPSVDTLRRGEAVGTLEELMRDGVIAKWGVACGEAAVAEVAIELGAPVIELPYNLFHQDDLNEVASKAVANNVGVLARSPLAYGLLCGTWPADKVFADGDHRRDRWNKDDLTERLRHVAALRPLVHDEVHTLRAAALRFVLANNTVSSCVVGVRNGNQLEQNVRAIAKAPPYLSEADLARLPELLGK
ncbi:MAG: aldo/keto reductase [Myxococcales bacterium]|nr:aldo/keto reductase [Myxococcales bacterium]